MDFIETLTTSTYTLHQKLGTISTTGSLEPGYLRGRQSKKVQVGARANSGAFRSDD
jgi:hypothetical protein